MAKYDTGTGVSGAMQGAQLGSAAGPWGALAGGVIGAGAGFFGKKKKKKKLKKLSTLDERQQKLNEEQYAALRGEGPLADLYNYDPEAANKVFDENIARYAYRDLNEKGIPGVTGQFRNQGLMQSSYAGDAISKLVRDVQESLDAKRSQYLYDEQKAARQSKQNAVENLQNRQTFNYYDDQQNKGSGNPVQNILSGFSGQDVSQGADWLQNALVNYTSGGVA